MNNKSFKDMSDKELMVEAQSLYQSIYITDCFGTSDLIRLELTVRELEKRDYAIQEIKTLKFIKSKEKNHETRSIER